MMGVYYGALASSAQSRLSTFDHECLKLVLPLISRLASP